MIDTNYFLLLIAIISFITNIQSYPYKLNCFKKIDAGVLMMGNPATTDLTKSIKVLRNGVPVKTGNLYIPGEELDIQISSNSTTTGQFKYIFEATGSDGVYWNESINTMCKSSRVYNLDGKVDKFKLQTPQHFSGTITIKLAWANQYGFVKIAEEFILIDPNPQPSKAPTSKPSKLTHAPNYIAPTSAPSIYSASAIGPEMTDISNTHPSSGTKYYTLVLRREGISGSDRPVITVNHTTPGPALRISLGQTISVKVINEMQDDVVTVHWHGMTQKNTPFMDGPMGLTQCPINTFVKASNTLLSQTNNATSLTYTFTPEASGTYWYHGHYNEQFIDGLYGMLIVEDAPATTAAYKAIGVQPSVETSLMFSTYFDLLPRDLADAYNSASSFGVEPIPDYIIVNNMQSRSMKIVVKRDQQLRLRLLNTAAMTMFRFFVDGLPITVIEADGTPLEPIDFASVLLNVGQRVSVVLDWSKLHPDVINSGSIMFHMNAEPAGVYASYDPTSDNLGLISTADLDPFNINWEGMFAFENENNVATYTTAVDQHTYCSSPDPIDSNILEASPLFSDVVPQKDLIIPYIYSEGLNSKGVSKFLINGQTFQDVDMSYPMLYDYILPSDTGGPLQEKEFYAKGEVIYGDGANPFVIPAYRTIDVLINSTVAMIHPIHLHGHSFWVIDSSHGKSKKPFKRDTVSVPGLGWVVIRFVSDNPGIWLLHCHIDWHMKTGMIAMIVESPALMSWGAMTIPDDHKNACPDYFDNLVPTVEPTTEPTINYSDDYYPTLLPTAGSPTVTSTVKPSSPSNAPTLKPRRSKLPTFMPSFVPSAPPADHNIASTSQPSYASVPPSGSPLSPSNEPTTAPINPSTSPINPSCSPTVNPTVFINPSIQPSVFIKPSVTPSNSPINPSVRPINPKVSPSLRPTTNVPFIDGTITNVILKPSSTPTVSSPSANVGNSGLNSQSKSTTESSNTGMIVGVVVGSIALICILALLGRFFYAKTNTKSKELAINNDFRSASETMKQETSQWKSIPVENDTEWGTAAIIGNKDERLSNISSQGSDSNNWSSFGAFKGLKSEESVGGDETPASARSIDPLCSSRATSPRAISPRASSTRTSSPRAIVSPRASTSPRASNTRRVSLASDGARSSEHSPRKSKPQRKGVSESSSNVQTKDW